MKREDLHYLISLALVISIVITALLGYIQARFELRRFVPHRYFAYITLGLIAVHVALNFKRIVKYIKKLKSKKQKDDEF